MLCSLICSMPSLKSMSKMTVIQRLDKNGCGPPRIRNWFFKIVIHDYFVLTVPEFYCHVINPCMLVRIAVSTRSGGFCKSHVLDSYWLAGYVARLGSGSLVKFEIFRKYLPHPLTNLIAAHSIVCAYGAMHIFLFCGAISIGSILITNECCFWLYDEASWLPHWRGTNQEDPPNILV